MFYVAKVEKIERNCFDDQDFVILLRIRKGKMRGKSFSGRLSWRIIGIVSAISIIAQIAVFFTFKWLQDSPVMHLVMLAIGLSSLAAIFFACRAVINYMTRSVSELSKAVLKMANGNLKAVLPEIKSEDEMRRLHDSFQTMQSSPLPMSASSRTLSWPVRSRVGCSLKSSLLSCMRCFILPRG